MIHRNTGSLRTDRKNRRRLRQEHGLRFGTWNIKMLNGKEVEVIQEMEIYKIDLLGISEVRKKGNGVKTLDKGHVLRYSGVSWNSRANEGVGIIVMKEMDRKVTSWEAINSRIMYLDLEVEILITLIQVSAPMEDSGAAEKDYFYEELQKQMDSAEDRRRKVIVGDLNGRVGNNYQAAMSTMGRFAGEATLNGNGQRTIDFCIENELRIANSIFKHKRINQITFESSSSQQQQQQQQSIIHYFLLQKQLRRFCRDVKVVRGAELSTDHYLLVADTLFVHGRCKKRRGYKKIKWEEFKNEQKEEEYKGKLEEKLREITTRVVQDAVEEKWQIMKRSILQACKEKVETEEILKVWRKYFKEKFNDIQQPHAEENKEINRNELSEQEEEEEETDEWEVEETIDRMKIEKAAGEDMVTPEMIKAGGRRLLSSSRLCGTKEGFLRIGREISSFHSTKKVIHQSVKIIEQYA
ncbi:hypothetical protein ANN_24673 [Periplaneta americana]|uniref:Craniofacial development protein 2-like n=1 Tax=Periplaneta americana TaxID=6978 RepID=A0ABQ8S3X7_PERAM|nr:hypothetical protein ANN_24673 [Periplaneta americana]